MKRLFSAHTVILTAFAALGTAGAQPEVPLTRALLSSDAILARAGLAELTEEEQRGTVPYGGRLLEARVRQLEGNLAQALTLYEEIAEGGEWADVALHEAMLLARETREPLREANALARLIDLVPQHPSRDDWALRLAELKAGQADLAAAQEGLRALRGRAHPRRVRREALSRSIALSLDGATPAVYADAVRGFSSLIAEDMDDDAALRATRAIAAYEERVGMSLDATALKMRGEVFYRSREWPLALRYLGRAAGLDGLEVGGFVLSDGASISEPTGEVRGSSGKSAELVRAEALFFIGRVYFRLSNYDSAARVYQLTARAASTPGLRDSARYQRIVCFERSGEFEAALEEAMALKDSRPGVRMEWLADRRRIGVLRSVGRIDEALQAIAETREGLRDPALRRELDWQEAAIQMQRDGERARELLSVFGRSGGEDALRANLLEATLLLSAGDRGDAVLRLQSVMNKDPSGFWGELALRRLVPLVPGADPEVEAAIESARQFLSAPAVGKANPAQIAKDRLLEIRRRSPGVFTAAGLEVLREAFARLDRYERGVAFPTIDIGSVDSDSPRYLRLLASGLTSESCFLMMAEPAAARGLDPLQRAAIYALGGELGRALYLAEVEAKRLPGDVVYDALHPGLLRLLYPLPGWLLEEGREAGVDLLLLAAIIREESRFKPLARSPAGARGVMQLVLDTAQALESGAIDPEELYDPRRSVELGSRYVRELMDGFEGSTPCTIAAYNAGPDAVREWSDRAGTGLLELEGEIEYAETKKYLRKVFLSYVRYQSSCARITGPAAALLWPHVLEVP